MNQGRISWLESVTGVLAGLTLALLPIFFLSITQDFYETNKWILLCSSALIVLLLWAVTCAIRGTIKIFLSPAAMGLGAMTIAATASLVVSSTNKVEALLSPLGVTSWASLTLIILLAGHLVQGKFKSLLCWLFFGSAGLAGLVAIYQFVGLGRVMFPHVTFLADPLWTPTGSSLTLLLWLALIFPLLVETAGEAIAQKKDVPAVAASVIALTSLGAIGVTLFQLIPMLPRVLLPFSDAWAVMLEVLKNPKYALFGVGTENFLAAFTAGRQLQMNAGQLWNVRFTTSSSFLLHMTTVWGLLGTAAMLLLVRVLMPPLAQLKSWLNQTRNRGLLVAQIMAVVVLVLMPPTLALVVVIAVILLLAHGGNKFTYEWHVPPRTVWLLPGIVMLASLLVAITAYGLGRIYLAELTFYQSLLAADRNNGTLTYNLQLKTTQLSPQLSRYHLAFSQTNLALATTLANQSTVSGELSPGDRQLITTFVQQSIREAKLAVALAPTNVTTWENLARLYQSLTPVASGADTWTVATYLKAVTLDPTNPVLRINLGAAYVTKKDYDSALRQFDMAASLKPNFANAYYNLAYAYRLKGDIPSAVSALEQTLSHVASGSSDWIRISLELSDLKKSGVSLPSQNQPGSLTAPSAPEPLVKPQLTLPDNAGPNIATAATQATPSAR